MSWAGHAFYFSPNHYKTLWEVVKCKRASEFCKSPFVPNDPLGKRLLHIGISNCFFVTFTYILKAELFKSVSLKKETPEPNIQNVKFEAIHGIDIISKQSSVLLEIKVPQKRFPIELAFVIDASTTEYLEETKNAISQVLDSLLADDVVHIFTWAKETNVIVHNGDYHNNANLT